MSNETKIPNNRVVGVISGSRSVEDAVTRLRSEGFDDVLVMSHVDTAGEGVNPISALMGMLAGHLSDETAYLDQYQEATRNGSLVVAVPANGEQTDRVREILELHGAVNIRYFGRLAVSDLTPQTNPSAPSG
jgi:hypothetical protein